MTYFQDEMFDMKDRCINHEMLSRLDDCNQNLVHNVDETKYKEIGWRNMRRFEKMNLFTNSRRQNK